MTTFFGKKKKWAPDANRKMTEIDMKMVSNVAGAKKKKARRQKFEGTMRVARRKVKGRRAGARWVAGGLRQIYSFEWTGGFHSAHLAL